MASKKKSSSSKKQPKSSKKAVARPKPSSSLGAIPAAPDSEATPVVAPRSLETTPPVTSTSAGSSPKDDRRAASTDRRLFRRIPFFRTIQYKFETIDQFKSEIAGDLSLGGIFIKTETPEPVGSVIYLEFDLRDGSKILAGYGKVVRVNPVGGQPDFDPGMGVEFLKFDEESTARIRQLVSERYR